MDDNLRHWGHLAKTDPAFTKQFTKAGGFTGTDINPTWRQMRMTERFGPCGIGWGMGRPTFEFRQSGDTVLVFCTVDIWYVDNGNRSEPIWGVGGDIVSKSRQNGVFVDDDACKKAFTDALGIAMKFVGMSADVYLKLFDDSKYRQDMKAEFSKAGGKEDWQKNESPNKGAESETDAKAMANKIKMAIDNQVSIKSLIAMMTTYGATDGLPTKGSYLDKIREDSVTAYAFLMDRSAKKMATFSNSPGKTA